MLCHDLKQCVSDPCGHTPAPDGKEMGFQHSLLLGGMIQIFELDGSRYYKKLCTEWSTDMEEKDHMQFLEGIMYKPMNCHQMCMVSLAL